MVNLYLITKFGNSTLVGVPRSNGCVRKFLVKSVNIPENSDIKFEEFQTEQTYLVRDKQDTDLKGFVFIRYVKIM